MLTAINPKLPMRDKAITRDYYMNKLGFQEYGQADYEDYLMLQKDQIQIHFFHFSITSSIAATVRYAIKTFPVCAPVTVI